MKKILITLTGLLLFSCAALRAQQAPNNKFVSDGVVEYEKKVNMFAVLPRLLLAGPAAMSSMYQQMIDSYKKTQPQFATIKTTLSFGKDKALYEPVPITGPANMYLTMISVTQNNIIYTDLAAHSTIAQKNILGEQFLVKDSVRAIKWKITDETRDVLGFHCRRANAVIMDSVYVVAFYTNDIPVSGGPESFSGLPGMILMVALPHDNITWEATKITEKAIPALNPPVKGKVVTNKELKAVVDQSMRNRPDGPQKQYLIKGALL